MADVMKDDEIKNAARSTLTPRSPSSSQNMTVFGNDVFMSPITPMAKNELKRKAEEDIKNNAEKIGKIERTNDDLYKLIVNLGGRLTNEIKNECASLKDELAKKMDEKMNTLNKNLEEIKSNVDEMEKKVESHGKKIDQQAKILNRLQQEKLQNKIEIVGTSMPQMKDKKEIKGKVMQMIKKYNIKVDDTNIKSVHIRNVKSNKENDNQQQKQIITVEFQDFDTKLRILKDKKKSKVKDGIFFDDALTFTNKYLIGKAKNIAKEKNFVVFMGSNRINVKKSENKIKSIEDETDLNDVQQWSPNKKRESENAQSSSSGNRDGSTMEEQ